MVRQCMVAAVLLSAGLVALGAAAAGPEHQTNKPSGWQLAPDADTRKSPLTVDEKVLKTGQAVFKEKCSKCHGRTGLGDGPDADPKHQEHMDLTNAKRAEVNSDGVVFYKVSNGRRNPKMPAFKEELTPDQIWSVVAFVQTLRKK